MDIESFWDAVLRQDAAAIREHFHPEAIVRWHCSNECFTMEEYIRANCEYPGQWAGEVDRVIRSGEELVAAVHVYTQDKALSFHVVSILRLREGKIVSMDEYWGDDGPAPSWRRDMGIGRKIK